MSKEREKIGSSRTQGTVSVMYEKEDEDQDEEALGEHEPILLEVDADADATLASYHAKVLYANVTQQSKNAPAQHHPQTLVSH